MKTLTKLFAASLLFVGASIAQIQVPFTYSGRTPSPNAPQGSCYINTLPVYNYVLGQYWFCVPNTSPPLNLGTWTNYTLPTTVLAGTSTGQMTTATASQVNALATAAAGVAAGSVGGAGLTSNTAVGNTGMQVCHATYNFAVDGGAVSTITPASNCTLPANSVIFNSGIEATTAGTSGGSATVAVGLSGTGGSTTALLGATAVASVTGRLQSAVVPQTASGWKKLTTAGAVTVTIATAALTAGVIEVYVMYYVSST